MKRLFYVYLASAARANINEQQKEIDHLNYEIENLQYQLNEERRERRAVEEQLTIQNIQNQQGRESVLTIPPSDVQLSDQTLGSGSYGGMSMCVPVTVAPHCDCCKSRLMAF